MSKTNWLGRLSAHLWRSGNRGGRSSRGLQLRQRRGGSHYSAIPAMIDVLESRRMLSGASVTDLAFVQDPVEPGMMTAHGQITGTVTGVTPGGSESAWIEIDRNGDGSVDGTTGVDGDSISYETDASFGSNLFKIRVIVSDAVAMTITPGDWQDFAFDVTPPANDPPTIADLQFEFTSVANGLIAGVLTGTVMDPDASAFGYTIELDLNDDGSPEHLGVAGASGSGFAMTLSAIDVNNTVFRVRAIETTATGILEGPWATLDFPLPPNTPPSLSNLSVEQSPANQGDTGRYVKISGAVIDDGVLFQVYDVEFDFDGDGIMDDWRETSCVGEPGPFEIRPDIQYAIGMNTIRIRAVEKDHTGRHLDSGWQTFTFEVTNAAPSFPQGNYPVEISFGGSEAGDVPFAIDPDQTPSTTTTLGAMDELKYTCDAPGISIDSSVHTFHIVDEAAFRRAVGSGASFTLTATDPFGKTGTTQITFRLAAGSTVIGTVKGIPQLIETITPLRGGAPAVVTHVLGGVTLTVSHETKSADSGSGLIFNTAKTTSIVRASSTAPIAGHPNWEVVYPVAPGAGQPGVITTGAPVTTADGQNQTITVSSLETVDIIDNSLLGGGALVARIVFTVSVTIQTDGTVTRAVALNGFVATPAYASFRNLNGSTSTLGGNAVLGP